MTIFVVIGVVLAAAALFLVAWPLLRARAESRNSAHAVNVSLYREQFNELQADLRAGTLSAENYDKARSELEARMLEDVDNAPAAAVSLHNGRHAAYALMIGLPLCAVALYAIVGTPGALAPQPVTNTAEGAASPHGTDEVQIEAMVATLAARLKADPSNGEGWMMLGRSYSSLRRHGEAAEAYKNAVAHSLPNAQLMADYADALAMAQGRQLLGEPEKLIARALEIDGKNMKALALAGTVAFEKRDYNGAVGFWSRMRALAQPDSEEARAIDANIAEARSLGGQGGTAAPTASTPASAPWATTPSPAATVTPPASQPGASSKSAAVSGVVKLAAELTGKVSSTDTVFIFARAANGPPMPLAVLRKRVSDLPVTFKLDDTMAMMPTMKLSDFPQVVLGARISKSANATSQPGDLQGVTEAVRNDAQGLLVIISNEVR